MNTKTFQHRAARLFLCGFLVLCGGSLLPVQAQQESDYQLGPQEGMVFLKNGQVLSGRISRSGDRYFVVLPQGEIQLTSQQVEFVCQSLEEGYWRKRETMDQTRVEDHLELTQWCLTHRLLRQAATELRISLELDAHHPKIPILERQLRWAFENQRKPATPTESAKPTSTKVTTTEMPVESPTMLQPQRTPQQNEGELLDALVKQLPEGAMAYYTQRVQPLLLNHCSTAQCHGSFSEAKWQLWRMPPDQPPQLRLSQRNLQETLNWIDSSDYTSSPLLTKAIEAHGGSEKAPMEIKDREGYRALAYWVQYVANSKAVATVQQINEQGEATSPTNTASTSSLPATQQTSAVEENSTPPIPRTDSIPINVEAPEREQRGLTIEEQLAQPHTPKAPASFTPKDPFDPEVFNRRYHGK
ncbi:Hypothetical protein PBC10988_15660 [Planctomycetales bacterium 10988]|nr:Hypothetical protein PBC10988_15660 [Planctomycetales bacterium 10988]